jgi:hypothetical protein
VAMAKACGALISSSSSSASSLVNNAMEVRGMGWGDWKCLCGRGGGGAGQPAMEVVAGVG